jgi:hypothetical protein
MGSYDVTANEIAASMPRGLRWLWIDTKDDVRSLPYDSITFESSGCLGAGLLMHRSGFQSLAPHYVTSVTDGGACLITATSGNQSWTVTGEGWSGPIELWGIERALESVIDKILWRPR